jgi:hypothetical protein
VNDLLSFVISYIIFSSAGRNPGEFFEAIAATAAPSTGGRASPAAVLRRASTNDLQPLSTAISATIAAAFNVLTVKHGDSSTLSTIDVVYFRSDKCTLQVDERTSVGLCASAHSLRMALQDICGGCKLYMEMLDQVLLEALSHPQLGPALTASADPLRLALAGQMPRGASSGDATPATAAFTRRGLAAATAAPATANDAARARAAAAQLRAVHDGASSLTLPTTMGFIVTAVAAPPMFSSHHLAITLPRASLAGLLPQAEAAWPRTVMAVGPDSVAVSPDLAFELACDSEGHRDLVGEGHRVIYVNTDLDLVVAVTIGRHELPAAVLPAVLEAGAARLRSAALRAAGPYIPKVLHQVESYLGRDGALPLLINPAHHLATLAAVRDTIVCSGIDAGRRPAVAAASEDRLRWESPVGSRQDGVCLGRVCGVMGAAGGRGGPAGILEEASGGGRRFRSAACLGLAFERSTAGPCTLCHCWDDNSLSRLEREAERAHGRRDGGAAIGSGGAASGAAAALAVEADVSPSPSASSSVPASGGIPAAVGGCAPARAAAAAKPNTKPRISWKRPDYAEEVARLEQALDAVTDERKKLARELEVLRKKTATHLALMGHINSASELDDVDVSAAHANLVRAVASFALLARAGKAKLNFTTLGLDFILKQLERALLNPAACRFDLLTLNLCVLVDTIKPAALEPWRTIFHLPSRSTVARAEKAWQLPPGEVSDLMLTIMREMAIVRGASAFHRQVVLVFDAVHVNVDPAFHGNAQTGRMV